jgi:hypothetical protein
VPSACDTAEIGRFLAEHFATTPARQIEADVEQLLAALLEAGVMVDLDSASLADTSSE